MIVQITTYTQYVVGRAVRTFTCEKCGCVYAYVLVRRGKGIGTSVYGIGADTAEDTAGEQAARQSQERLAGAMDPVECPDCGWFQQEMLGEVGKRAWPWTPWGTGRRIDPNRGYPLERGRLPGMPAPVRVKAGSRPKAQTGRRPAPELEPGGCVTIQPAADPVPGNCVACLEPADQSVEFRRLIDIDTVIPAIALPMCRRCVEAAARRGTKIMTTCFIVVPIVVAVAGGFLLSRLVVARQEMFPIIGGAGLGVTAGAIIAWLVQMAIRIMAPKAVRVVGYDPVRHTYRLRFRNPRFTEALRERVAQEPLVLPEAEASEVVG